MLDPVSIAAIAAPYLAKGADALAKTAGEKIGGIVGDLAQSVANKFKGDSFAEQTLAGAQEKPDSKARQGALQAVLAEKMEDDTDFAKTVQKLVDALQKGSAGSVFDQRGQTVHGPQTNITGGGQGSVFSGQFSGPVAQGGDANDFRGAVGTIYKPSASVRQHFGDVISGLPRDNESTHSDNESKKIKALFLASNPKGTTTLELDREIRGVTEKIRASEYRDSLDLISAWAVRPDDLLQLLNQHKPQIVHFSGHGRKAGEIILVDSHGSPKPVNPAALRALFETLKDNIRLVILNACYSKKQAEAITQVIDCAIGMNDAIGDEAAITFAASFYRAIGFGRSIKQAFDQGIVALLLEGIPEENKPELLTRNGVNPEKIVLVPPEDE
ncbi:MAG: CHAT domain-containing protein [Methanosarcinales archaeon]|nr:CHAT domain-containing protein [Methanosarcinales archaeon]